MECEMFGAPLDNDELTNELDALIALDAEKELGELGPLPVIKTTKKAVPIEEEEEEEEEKIKKPKKQMVAA